MGGVTKATSMFYEVCVWNSMSPVQEVHLNQNLLLLTWSFACLQRNSLRRPTSVEDVPPFRSVIHLPSERLVSIVVKLCTPHPATEINDILLSTAKPDPERGAGCKSELSPSAVQANETFHSRCPQLEDVVCKPECMWVSGSGWLICKVTVKVESELTPRTCRHEVQQQIWKWNGVMFLSTVSLKTTLGWLLCLWLRFHQHTHTHIHTHSNNLKLLTKWFTSKQASSWYSSLQSGTDKLTARPTAITQTGVN